MMHQSSDRDDPKAPGKAAVDPGTGTGIQKPTEHRGQELEEKVIQLTRTNRQLKRKIFDLYTIFELSRNFNAVLDYKSLLDSFVLTCLGQVGALRGAIFLKKETDSHDYHMICSRGSGELPGKERFFRDDTVLVEYIRRLNRPVLTDELSMEVASPDEREILKCFEYGVLVPLVFQTRLAGLFLVADKMAGGDFSPDDLEFLSGLGNQISVAIENARLYEAEKSAIQQLRAAQQQLVQSERLAALGEMSAKIAHEVNNPLGIIKNYILLLQRVGAASADAKEYTEIVGQEIDRIAFIVRQLREYQRPVRVEPEPVDVRKIMEDTLRLMERQLQTEEISLVREFDEGEFIIEGCADSVKQVFLNLIINARAEMDGGGLLTISMKRRGKDLVLQIRDTGQGIPAEIIPRIFEPFFTTKGEKGTGLGLSVCYGIINSLSGSIIYENREDGGCFEIILPLVDERTENGGEV